MATDLLLKYGLKLHILEVGIFIYQSECMKDIHISMFLEKDSEVRSWTPNLPSRAVLYFQLLFSFPTSKYFLFLYSCRQFLPLAGTVILWNMCSTYLGSNRRKILQEGQNPGEVLLTARVSSARDSPRSHPWNFIAEYHLSSHCPSRAQGTKSFTPV